MDISAKNNIPKATRCIQGGYGTVSVIAKTNEVIKKLPLFYEPGCLSFNAIADALFSRAASYFDCTPTLFDIFTDAKSLYIKMPYLGTSLYSLSRWQRKKHAIQILGDIAKVCMELEAIGIQHTDIKHSNVLLSKSGEVCLIDFNICSIQHVNPHSIWTQNLGTWEYASPEICLLQSPTNTSTVWSLAILMCFLFGEHPLHADMENRDINSSNKKEWSNYIIHLSKQNPIGLPLPSTLTKAMPLKLRKLFHQCTYWDPVLRIDLQAFYQCIRSFKEYKVRPSVKFPPRSFVMRPISSEERNRDVDRMRNWCKEVKYMHLLCRSIAMYDRISYYERDDLNAPACLAISYMLVGNYVLLEDENMAKLAEIFHIRDWALFLKHVIDVCSGLEWDIYELTADVMLLQHMDSEKDLYPMIETVFEIQKHVAHPYTMKSLTNDFIRIAKMEAQMSCI
jgi:serine/threonine protein kinase